MNDGWMMFWQMVLIAVMLVYGIVAVRVAISGWGDIRRMLKGIDAGHSRDENSKKPKT